MSDFVIDAQGRRITLRPVTVIDQYRIAKALGPAQSANQMVAFYADTAILAAAIDGVPVPFPANEGHVEALIGRLGDDGMQALMLHRQALIEAVKASAELARAEGQKPDPLAPSAASPNTPD